MATNNFPTSAAASQSVIRSAAKNLASVAIPPRFFAVLRMTTYLRPSPKPLQNNQLPELYPANSVWAAKTAANRLAKLRRNSSARRGSIAPKGDAVKGSQGPDRGSRLGKNRQRRHDDDVIGREAARLDSPDQRPGTNAEATPHKAQRAVTPSPRVTAPWALEPRHGNPIPQASGLAVEFGPVGALAVPKSCV